MRKIINALVFGMAGGLLLAETVFAHAAYLRSEPGAEAIVATPPSRVDIWFEQELFRRKGENTITVTGPDGRVVSTGDTEIDDDDRTHIWVNLHASLPAGKYLVDWKNLSLEDGHPSEGSFHFIIDPQAKVTSTPMGISTSSVTMTNSPLPQSTRTDFTTLPAPTTAPAPADNPCPIGLAPVGVLVAFGFMLRFRRK
jgi:methionine-rich copper-binding protein CopC